MPTITHNYSARQDTLQQYRTVHTFADHNCHPAMIALINKQPTIRLKMTTVQQYSLVVQFVKHTICDGNEVLCIIANSYVCSTDMQWTCSGIVVELQWNYSEIAVIFMWN